MEQFHSHLSDGGDHDSSTTTAHISILIQFLHTKEISSPLLTTMCDKTDGCAK